MRKLRFLLFLAAAVLIAGLLPGSFLRSGIRSGSSGGGGGVGTGSASSDPKIFLLVEQGAFINLRPSVYDGDDLLEPVGVTTEEYLSEDRDLDVYRVLPGRSFVVFSNVNPETKGDAKVGNDWSVELIYSDHTDTQHVRSASTVAIPEGVDRVLIYHHIP